MKLKQQKHIEVPRLYANGRVIERPGGFYWKSENGNGEHGPFPTVLDAVTDMQSTEDSEYEPEDSFEADGSELGIGRWIDPDTGQPGEEWMPRIEDH
jgi:hypothetical protein